MKINTIEITTGNFSVVLTGNVKDEHIQDLVEKGIKSEVYRKVFPKTELQMAITTGQTEFKDGKHRKLAGFKRDNVAWDADLAAKLQAIVQEQMGNGFVAEVKQYIPADPKNTQQKAYEASLVGLDAAKAFMTEEQYADAVKGLKSKYGQD